MSIYRTATDSSSAVSSPGHNDITFSRLVVCVVWAGLYGLSSKCQQSLVENSAYITVFHPLLYVQSDKLSIIINVQNEKCPVSKKNGKIYGLLSAQ